jgi:hypothetical protein
LSLELFAALFALFGIKIRKHRLDRCHEYSAEG